MITGEPGWSDRCANDVCARAFEKSQVVMAGRFSEAVMLAESLKIVMGMPYWTWAHESRSAG